MQNIIQNIAYCQYFIQVQVPSAFAEIPSFGCSIFRYIFVSRKSMENNVSRNYLP